MSQIFIKKTRHKGRGVFSKQTIKKGKLIEVCEILIVDSKEIGSFLERYVFEFNKSKVALALGFGSLYNHQDNPNARCELDTKKMKLYFYSIKEILPSEEITIDYGYSESDKLRFGLS